MEPDPERWAAWQPAEAAARLASVQAPWCVAAGWAIDLFLGGHHREHEDLEIAVPHDRFAEVAEALSGLEIFVPVGEGRLGPYDLDGESHQTWFREPDSGLWRIDVFREPADGDTWLCRRDERLRMPYRELIDHTADGIPYTRPDVVLLFKAKHARPKDEADFEAALPLLPANRRAWLGAALELVHPGHPWLARI